MFIFTELNAIGNIRGYEHFTLLKAPQHIYRINAGTPIQFRTFKKRVHFIKSIVVLEVLRDKSRVFKFTHNARVFSMYKSGLL